MDDLKAKADAFLTERKAGGDFNALCAENASEDDKANYEDTESDYSLKEGQRKSFCFCFQVIHCCCNIIL